MLGYQGIHQFSIVRRNAIRALAEQRQNGVSRYDVAQGDFFHNGEELLPEVRQWHEGLRQAVRRTDHITVPLLDFVEKHMLTPTETRLPAEELYPQIQQLMDQIEVEQIPPEMDALMKTLFVIDQDAASTPGWVAKERTVQHNVSNNLTNKPPFELLKTASRFEALSRVSGFVTGNLATAEKYQVHPEAVYHTTGTDQTTEALHQSRLSLHGGSPPHASIQRRPTVTTQRNSSGHGGQLPHQPQNVIQAAEQSGNTNWGMSLKRGDPDHVLRAYFDNRDIKFLVDNASSMTEHWDEATFLLETLVKKAAPFDPDGMDLYFTLGREGVQGKRKAEPFRSAMTKARPKPGWSTDMTGALERIFKEYFDTVAERRRKRKSPKEDLTLIILTDGIWGATDDKEEVGRYVVTVLKKLEELGIYGFKKRPVSIEFVQLGDDDDATLRLEALDNDMPVKGYKYVYP